MDALTRMLLSNLLIYKVSDRISALHMKETCGSYFQPEPLLEYNRYRLQTGLCKAHTLLWGYNAWRSWNLHYGPDAPCLFSNDPRSPSGTVARHNQSIIRPSDTSTWNWAVLSNKRSGELTVTLSRRRLHLFPRHSRRAPRNPAEKD